MSMPGMEQVFTEVLAKLEADMPAKVQQLNEEFMDDILLENPGTYGYEMDTTSAFPAILLQPYIPTELVTSPPSLGDEYGIDHRFVVKALVREPEFTRKLILLMRYHRAIKEILAARNTLSCGAIKYIKGGFMGVHIRAEFVVTTYQRPS